MGIRQLFKKYENCIIAVLVLAALCLVLGIRYDYYYDLNDDVVMKDILAGIYTGTPEGHNIQMLYPLGWVIALLYRAFPGMPVYGIILWLCQFGSLWLVLHRSLRFAHTALAKLLLAGAEGGMALALLAGHLVFVQYTFTSAMLAAAAAFLFITCEPEKEAGRFIRKNIPCILLALLSYLFRTEMLLLLLPLICVAGVYRWSLEKGIFARENLVKYLSAIGGILVGMAVVSAIHSVAYGSPQWKEFMRFFDLRTELYDFQGIPPYEGNEELYEGLGMTEHEQYMLLDQYNFGLDEAVDASALEEISAYQSRSQGEGFLGRLKEKLWLSIYRTFHKEPAGSAVPDDYPWNMAVVLGYLALAVAAGLGRRKHPGRDQGDANLALAAAAGLGKRKHPGRDQGDANLAWAVAVGLWKPFLLVAVRMALWLFILMLGRDPVRITHSLYLMELSILVAMLLVECARLTQSNVSPRTKAVAVFPTLFALLAAVSLGECLAETDRDYEAREAARAMDGAMKEYSRGNEGNFYFMDVYSAVSYPLEPYASTPYSEKLFEDVEHRLGNYDIMGGWLVKSPLYEKKLEQFGITSMEDGLLYKDNVYMMAELEKGTGYIKDYFADRNIGVQVTLTDKIGGLIGVYQIEVKD